MLPCFHLLSQQTEIACLLIASCARVTSMLYGLDQLIGGKMKTTTIGISLANGKSEINEISDRQQADFKFDLESKEIRLGKTNLEHFWLDNRSIYPSSKNKRDQNYLALVDFWHEACRQDGALEEKDVCESLILAKILPKIRPHGTRRIFLDSKIGKQGREDRRDYLSKVNDILLSSYDQQKTVMEFYRNVGDIIGPPKFSDDLWDRFEEFKHELFDDAIVEIQGGGVDRGISLATEQWEAWKDTICAHRRDKEAMTIIDIFGYEARAAIHRCYSTLWEELTEWLYHRSGENPRTHAFHHLWHRDIAWPANEPEAIKANGHFHLLHGHIFALHPAAGDFIQTQAGKKLLSEWLTAAGKDWKQEGVSPEIPEFCRLLNGLGNSFYLYQDRHNSRSESNFRTEFLTEQGLSDLIEPPGKGRRKPK